MQSPANPPPAGIISSPNPPDRKLRGRGTVVQVDALLNSAGLKSVVLTHNAPTACDPARCGSRCRDFFRASPRGIAGLAAYSEGPPVSSAPQPQRPFRFSSFEADPQSSELRKNGVRLRIQDQPFQILLKLLERPGQLVP